jgi:hypothetical protein
MEKMFRWKRHIRTIQKTSGLPIGEKQSGVLSLQDTLHGSTLAGLSARRLEQGGNAIADSRSRESAGNQYHAVIFTSGAWSNR